MSSSLVTVWKNYVQFGDFFQQTRSWYYLELGPLCRIPVCRNDQFKKNKPRTAKVGAISKVQTLKGGPFGLCETPAGCKKYKKKLKGGPFGDMKKFPNKSFLI